MKDIFSAFGSEVFRPLATLVLPGLLATVPGLIAVALMFPDVRTFMAANHAETAIAATLLATFAGLILEDCGARLEKSLFDRKFRKTLESRYKDWHDYLRIAYTVEPVGHRYMRTLVLRLKFELGCTMAVPFCITEIWLWPVTYSYRLIWTAAIGVCGIYLMYEAWASVGNLADLRAELLQGTTPRPGTRGHEGMQ